MLSASDAVCSRSTGLFIHSTYVGTCVRPRNVHAPADTAPGPRARRAAPLTRCTTCGSEDKSRYGDLFWLRLSVDAQSAG